MLLVGFMLATFLVGEDCVIVGDGIAISKSAIGDKRGLKFIDKFGIERSGCGDCALMCNR
jgi:hypothetical protein